MRKVRAFLVRLGGFLRPGGWAEELDAELKSNLELHVEDNIRAGMSPSEARRSARLRYGSLASARDAYRDRKLVPSLDDVARDLRQSARSLRKSKGFSCAVVATLALAIGANTTALSALYGLILKPLPVDDPDRVVQLFNIRTNRLPGDTASHSSWIQYVDLRARTDLFETCALRSTFKKIVTDRASSRRVKGHVVTAEIFDLMNAQPIVGRFFSLEEVDPLEAKVVVLTQTTWETEYGADRGVVGEQIRFDNGVPYTIIGVAPRKLEAFDYEARYFIPYQANSRARDPARGRYNSFSDDLWLRLRKGVTREAALQEIQAIERQWYAEVASADARESFRDYKRFAFGMPHPLEGWLFLLEGGALFILLVGCFNVTVLILNRLGQRYQELSIRSALGAARSALRRLMLVENALLVSTAVGAGLLLAWGGVSVVDDWPVGRGMDMRIEGREFVFSVVEGESARPVSLDHSGRVYADASASS